MFFGMLKLEQGTGGVLNPIQPRFELLGKIRGEEAEYQHLEAGLNPGSTQVKPRLRPGSNLGSNLGSNPGANLGSTQVQPRF